MFHQVILISAHALGNGTRHAGTLLGTVGPCESIGDVVEAARSHASNKLGGFAYDCRLADGVEAVELLTALRNDHLVRFEAADPPDFAPDNEDESQSNEPDPLDRKLSTLESLQTGDVTTLNGAGLLTVGDVLGFDEEHGLETITGIGAARRKKLLEAIEPE